MRTPMRHHEACIIIVMLALAPCPLAVDRHIGSGPPLRNGGRRGSLIASALSLAQVDASFVVQKSDNKNKTNSTADGWSTSRRLAEIALVQARTASNAPMEKRTAISANEQLPQGSAERKYEKALMSFVLVTAGGSSTGISILGFAALLICGLIVVGLVANEGTGDSPTAGANNGMHYGSFPQPGAMSAGQLPPTSVAPRFPVAFSGSHSPSVSGSAQLQQQQQQQMYANQMLERQHGGFSQSSGSSRMGSFDVQALAFTRPEPPSTAQQARPIPICADLVLPLCESWFAISFEAIDQANGHVPVYGLSGKLLLAAYIQKDHNTGQGMISISMRQGGPSLGTLTSSAGPMIIRDKTGTQYGELNHTGFLSYSLVSGAGEVARIVYDQATGEMLMRSTVDGGVLASACKCADLEALPNNDVALQVKVSMGMDPSLALLCIVGSMTFAA